MRREYSVFFKLLALAAGGTMMALALRNWPEPLPWRGFSIGLAGGIAGTSLFLVGVGVGRAADGSTMQPAGPLAGPPPATKEDAKALLQQFLNAHEKRPNGS